ncbi:MAG: hypothetical protein OSJ72_14355 [Lachnospiraceae bacterium]|nr:hypothetical protein [Lachnospiraceae bacterium]
MYEFLSYITIFQIVTDIYDLLIGSALVFGALKWRKGLLTTTAFYWGLVLGFLSGAFIAFSLDTDISLVLVTTVIGAAVFPILTYCVPAVNRFVLGFLVTMKLLYMITTYLCKNGNIEFETVIIMPLIVAAILGLILAAWRKMSVLPFALACVFLGASQVAPTLAKYVNQFVFGITHDYSLLFDPIDFIFALFKIELTDGWTLFFMIILMCIGLPIQLKSVKQQGYTYDTPIIAFETDDPNMHGKIISKK